MQNEMQCVRSEFSGMHCKFNETRNQFNDAQSKYNAVRNEFNTTRSNYNVTRNDFSAARSKYNAVRNEFIDLKTNSIPCEAVTVRFNGFQQKQKPLFLRAIALF